ncbi:MAG TPA: RES family NAD+ phosphorylase [Rhodanobacteraceae bacterium]|nr:RES family NAD+ phosphorylase [Rhodanobacteraceae bacterium]
MQVWRISAFTGLSGIGGHHVDGRWHAMPRSVLYVAEHPALAMVEVMAHMRLSVESIPTRLRIIRIEIGEGAVFSERPQLPQGWQANEITTRTLGNAWLDEGSALVLPVPSAVVPSSTNYLINPAHPQAATHLRESSDEPFWFDARFLR